MSSGRQGLESPTAPTPPPTPCTTAQEASQNPPFVACYCFNKLGVESPTAPTPPPTPCITAQMASQNAPDVVNPSLLKLQMTVWRQTSRRTTNTLLLKKLPFRGPDMVECFPKSSSLVANAANLHVCRIKTLCHMYRGTGYLIIRVSMAV
jgi:hypothetical protein